MQDQATKPKRRVLMKNAPGVYRSSSGKYEIAYTDSDGKLRFKTIGTNLEEAKAARAQIVGRKGKGERIISTKLTLAEYAEQNYFAALQLRPRTIRTYQFSFDRYAKPTLGRKRIAEINVDDVARLVAQLSRDGYAAWTVRSMLTVLGRIFASAERANLIPSNPVRKLDQGERPSVVGTERRILTEAEQAALLKEAGMFKALIAVGMFAGLRLGEALGLRWQDIDFDGGFVRVRQQLGYRRELNEPKTKRSRRDVVLMPQLAKLLREHRMQSRFKAPDDFLFPAPDGRGRDRASTSAGIAKAVNRADVGPLTFHALRHGFASMLITGLKQDVETVSSQLGHANSSITLSLYSHEWDKTRSNDELRTAMSEAFGHLLDAASVDS